MTEYEDHPAFKSGVWYMAPTRSYEASIRKHLLEQRAGVVKSGVLNCYFIFWVEDSE